MDWPLFIFTFWHTSGAIFGCITNLLLIYLCIFKSPKFIRVYGIFIINFAITDFLECFFDMFLEFRSIPIPGETKVVWQFNGFCQFISLKSCQYGSSIFLHCIPYGYWSLLLSFSYRYYILNHPGLERKHILCALLIIYIPSFIQMITFSQNLWDIQPALDLVYEKFPSYDMSNTLVTAFDIISSPSAFYAIAYSALPVYPVYISIFILRRKIIAGLDANKRLISKETKAMHQQMLKCLTYQTLIPVVMIIAAGLYFLVQFGIVNNRGIELAIMSIYLPMPVLSSLTYLFFVRPYREFCQRLFCKKISNAKLQFHSTGSKVGGRSQVSTVQI